MLVQAGPGWSRLVLAGPGWYRLVQDGSGWSRLVQAGFRNYQDNFCYVSIPEIPLSLFNNPEIINDHVQYSVISASTFE